MEHFVDKEMTKDEILAYIKDSLPEGIFRVNHNTEQEKGYLPYVALQIYKNRPIVYQKRDKLFNGC
ncbi:MAG: hypothetical protein WC783_04370 [Candidatus Paceibacterota bacterium]|jgi:hypothetical protein